MKGWETGAGGSGRQRRRRPWRQSTALAPPAPPAHLAGGGAIVVPGGQVLGLGGHLVENPGLGALQGERLRREAGAREGGEGGLSTRGGTGNWQRGGLGRACRPGRSLALGHPRHAPQSLTMSCIVPPIQTYLQQEGEAGVRWADGRRESPPHPALPPSPSPPSQVLTLQRSCRPGQGWRTGPTGWCPEGSAPARWFLQTANSDWESSPTRTPFRGRPAPIAPMAAKKPAAAEHETHRSRGAGCRARSWEATWLLEGSWLVGHRLWGNWSSGQY